MTSKRVLVIQNFENTELGQVSVALDEADIAIDQRVVYSGDPLPSKADGHDGIIVLGGGQNALDDVGSPYIPALLELMLDFVRRDKPVLGICLGSQLLARALGATNHIGTASEFGWQPVELTKEGDCDPVLSGLPERFPIFQWHDDHYSLPEGAVRLASSPVARNQAFRFGRAAYGFQFHFEADRRLVRDWSVAFTDWLAERQPDWTDRLDGEAARHGPIADEVGLRIARGWTALLQDR